MARLMRMTMVWIVCAAVLLGGCSGAGLSTSSVRQQGLRTFSADHLAAVVLVKGWLSAALRSYPMEEARCVPDGDFEPAPEGGVHVWGTNSDCSTYDFIDRGGVGEGTWVLADGRRVDVSWETLQQGFTITRERIVRRFWDGARMEFVATWEFSANTAVEREGTLTLADGRTMDFTATQVSRVEEIVSMALPDGSACEYRVPLKCEGIDEFIPVYEDGVEGTYTAPDGRVHHFTVTGDEVGLNEWEVTADGLLGEFTIGEQYAGDGTISRDGQLASALTWTTPASATIHLLLGGSAEVGPGGAALDFAVDRWISNRAGLGPMPVF